MEHQRLTNKEVKKKNRNQIFRYICTHGTVSNPDIVSDLHLSLPTVTNTTRELLESGLLRDLGEMQSTGGRRARALCAASDYRFSIGLDITRNHLGILLLNLTGDIIKYERIQLGFSRSSAYFSEVCQKIDDFLLETEISGEQILGLGISLPGIVDPVQKMITYSHALGVRDLPFGEIQSSFPWHCTFLNDANAGAFAEGIGSDLPSSFFYLSLSNTVGGAIFHDGNLLPGNAFRCGEAGHMTLIPDGKPCYCGKTGCVDAYCSARVLSDLSGRRLEDFFLGLQQNNPDYRSVWDTYLKHLAVVINNLHMLLDYDIVLGGYVGSFLTPWLDTIRHLVAERNTFEDDGSFVKLCTYQTGAAAYGAAMDVMEGFLRTV